MPALRIGAKPWACVSTVRHKEANGGKRDAERPDTAPTPTHAAARATPPPARASSAPGAARAADGTPVRPTIKPDAGLDKADATYMTMSNAFFGAWRCCANRLCRRRRFTCLPPS